MNKKNTDVAMISIKAHAFLCMWDLFAKVVTAETVFSFYLKQETLLFQEFITRL